MRKLMGGAVLALLAGCASPEQQAMWNQAVARLPPGATSYCEMQSMQISSNYYNRHSVLGLEQAAMGNKARNTCLQMLIEQNGGFQPVAMARPNPQYAPAPQASSGSSQLQRLLPPPPTPSTEPPVLQPAKPVTFEGAVGYQPVGQPVSLSR